MSKPGSTLCKEQIIIPIVAFVYVRAFRRLLHKPKKLINTPIQHPETELSKGQLTVLPVPFEMTTASPLRIAPVARSISNCSIPGRTRQ